MQGGRCAQRGSAVEGGPGVTQVTAPDPHPARVMLGGERNGNTKWMAIPVRMGRYARRASAGLGSARLGFGCEQGRGKAGVERACSPENR